MRKEVIILGAILLVAGFVLAIYSTKVHMYYDPTIEFDGRDDIGYYKIVYPYVVIGIIVVLIGFVTVVIGYYIPHQTSPQTQEEKTDSETIYLDIGKASS